MAYKKDLDYTSLIKLAAEMGDLTTAARLEGSRNEKIEGEGLDYEKTSNFTNYLGKAPPAMGESYSESVDYGTVLRSLMDADASSTDIRSTLQSRVDKALNTPGLSQYAYDDTYKQAREQIKGREDYDALLDSLISGSSGGHKAGEDEAYSAAATRYRNAGKAASEDVLGDYAALTGGLPSTAAVSAAQGAQNAYNSQLSAFMQSDSAGGGQSRRFEDSLKLLSALKSEKQEKSQKAYDMALALIESGNMPAKELLDDAGIDSDYAKQLAEFYKYEISLRRALGK